jgi:hypothetical protein
MEGTVRRGRRCKRLLDYFKEKRGYRKFREESLDINVENSLRKRLWTCSKTGSRMNYMNTRSYP